MTSSEYVDWRLAASTGARLAPPGPRVSAAEAGAIVADLRAAAVFAQGPIAETTRLATPADAPAALVVDRSSWIEANLQTFAAVMDPVVARLREVGRHTPAAARTIGAKVSGAEAGAVLSFLATKVLGQYDLAPSGTPRLLLVAPNIVEAERELEVDPGDFRRWVAMHEETHRVQFTAVPWLREHLVALMQELADGVAGSPEELVQRLAEAGKHLREAFGPSGQGVAGLFLTAEQRQKVADATAVMALLEGHADVMMDEVGPSVIPTVGLIRERFTERRRRSKSGADRVIRRLMGLDAKTAQYVEGAAFVRAVIASVGLDGFNAVWTSPHTLPTAEEIKAPGVWVGRVHG